MSGLNNLGDDVVNDFVNASSKLLEAILAIVSAVEKSKKNKLEMEKLKAEVAVAKESTKGLTNAKKVAFGKMSESDYKAMVGSEKMNVQYVAKEQLENIENLSKKLGAKYFVMDVDEAGKTAAVIIPDKYMPQFGEVLKAATEQQLKQDDKSLIMNRENLISADNKEIVDDVMDFSMLPVYKFDVGEDRMYVVPAEYEGQYNAALKDANSIKERLQSVDIDFFNQLSPLDDIDYRVERISPDKADYLSSELKDKISFFKDENDNLYCKYPAQAEEQVTSLSTDYDKHLKMSEDYLIKVVDNKITMNESLIESQTENEYFFRVPNTSMQDYIKLDKSDVSVLDNGKTLQYSLDYNKQYQIYDRDGNIKTVKTGAELAENYNTKNQLGNAHTQTSHHYNDNLDRIELYNASQDKMMRIGIRSAAEVKGVLVANGISPVAADKICEDINKQLPEQYKSIYNFTPPQTRFTAEKLENAADIIAQSKVAETIKNAECISADKAAGRKCFIYDKKEDKYIIANTSDTRQELMDKLHGMGYTPLQAHCISKMAMKEAVENDFLPDINDVQSFDSKNPEISKLRYAVDKENDIIVLGKPEIVDGKPEMNNIILYSGVDRASIENAIKKGLDIHDPSSIAECMKCMDDANLIPDAPHVSITVNKQEFTVSKLSSEYVRISSNENDIVMPKKDISAEKISKVFSIDDKSANNIQKSIERALNSNMKTSSLSKLKQVAEKTFKTLEQKKAQDKSSTISEKIQTHTEITK